MIETSLEQERKTKNGLWRPYGEAGTLLGTYVPNCFLKGILSIKLGVVELKVLFLISRMSFGFEREHTNYLAIKDFKDVTGKANSHLSKAIKSLLKQKIIFRTSKNGNMYKYAINLLPYNVKMKHYRFAVPEDELSSEEFIIGKANYRFGNFAEVEDNIIVYNPKGYSKQEKVYIKKDINTDIKKDNVKSGSKIAEVHSNSIDLSAKQKLFLGGFKNKFNSNPTADTILEYLKMMKHSDVSFDEFYTEYSDLYIKNEKSEIIQQHYDRLFNSACKMFGIFK